MGTDIAPLQAVAGPRPSESPASQTPQSPATQAAPGKASQMAAVPDIGVRYAKNKDSDDWVMSIVDLDTNKVIREIPPEDVQRLHAIIRALEASVQGQKG